MRAVVAPPVNKTKKRFVRTDSSRSIAGSRVLNQGKHYQVQVLCLEYHRSIKGRPRTNKSAITKRFQESLHWRQEPARVSSAPAPLLSKWGGVVFRRRALAPPLRPRAARHYISLRSSSGCQSPPQSAARCLSIVCKTLRRLLTMRYCVAALWLSALTTLAVAAADDALHDAAPPQKDNELELTDEEKRAWSSLHGGWGKRGWQDMSSAWGKRAWQDLNTAWGKRGWNDMSSAWGKRAWQDLNSAWGKRGWQDLNSAWGKRAWRDMPQTPWGKRGWQDMSSAWGKRGWNDMSSAWGKRGWNDMSSAWGKRGWNDMSSAWGKRGPEKWANFHGSWGKRAAEPDYEEIDAAIEQLIPIQQLSDNERMEAPEKKAWSALHGAWGKRPVKQAQYNSESSARDEA